MSKPALVYILADQNQTVYVDVTKDIEVAVLRDEERSRLRLRVVLIEEFPDMKTAVARSEALRASGEAEILLLVNSRNPEWNDLLRRPVPYGVAGPDAEGGEGGVPAIRPPKPTPLSGAATNAIPLPTCEPS